MSRLVQAFEENDLTIVVALPANDVEMAVAAERNGAHAIKVHLDMVHRASGQRFGSLEEERGRLEAILEAVRIPVGIVPGAHLGVRPELIATLAEMGFDFWDMFVDFVRPELLRVPGISRMVAIAHGWEAEASQAFAELGVDMCEAAIVPKEGYGEPLSLADVAHYARLKRHLPVPTVAPSQRALTPSDLPFLKAAGLDGILIGVLSTGTDAEALARQTAAFREAAERLGKQPLPAR